MGVHVNRSIMHSMHRMSAERKKLVTNLANGFEFGSLAGKDRRWLRRRRMVNQTGLVTDKGRQWASELLAREADELMAGNICQDMVE